MYSFFLGPGEGKVASHSHGVGALWQWRRHNCVFDAGEADILTLETVLSAHGSSLSMVVIVLLPE
jgi:hypothetical protein